MNSKTDALRVRVVREASIDELIARYPQFSRLKSVRFPNRRASAWELAGEDAYCLQTMCIGKTGYGKSTTLNQICGRYFETDEINSCTKTLFSCEYRLFPRKPYYASFCDLPGIGESSAADKPYYELYARMMRKSACVVYVLRADQRDFAIDAMMFDLLESKQHIIAAVNCADKIEPVSRTAPFTPSAEQLRNLEKKSAAVAQVLRIPQESVVCFSATEGYNMNLLLSKILAALTEE